MGDLSDLVGWDVDTNMMVRGSNLAPPFFKGNFNFKPRSLTFLRMLTMEMNGCMNSIFFLD